jgi:hypothetical protein
MDRAFVPCWAPRSTCAAGECPRVPVLDTRRRAVFLACLAHHGPGASTSAVLHRARAESRAKHASNGDQLAHAWCRLTGGGGEILRIEEVWRADDSCSRSTSCSLRVPQCSDLILLYTVAVESVKTYLTLPLYIWLKEVRIATLTTLPTSLKHHSILCYYPHGGFQRPWQVLDDGKSG